jgi:hypothetical protein
MTTNLPSKISEIVIESFYTEDVDKATAQLLALFEEELFDRLYPHASKGAKKYMLKHQPLEHYPMFTFKRTKLAKVIKEEK